MLDLFFLTSSRAKLDHIRYLLRGHAINIRPSVDYGKPYEEPRIFDRERLLSESIEDANRRLGRNLGSTGDISGDLIIDEAIEDYAHLYQGRLFIIEDTSVIIEALSDRGDYPGLDVKYWMKETNFEEIDRVLKENGNNRNVTVRSDIVLYLPRKLRSGKHYILFTSYSKGTIVEKEIPFKTNPLYPWLDNKTFNKWFVPENKTKPISRLSIKSANKYDFRRGAIIQLTDYLRKKHILVEKVPERIDFPRQATFFDSSNIILCGPSCAGKSLLATHLSRKYGYYHVEASDFMYLSFYKKHGFSSSISIHDFALQALEDDPEIVTKQILNHIEERNDSPIIITGFRSPDELIRFTTCNRKYTFCFIDANPEIRYERCVIRGRLDMPEAFEEFVERDVKQNNMGLLAVKAMLEFDLVSNESTKYSYFRQFRVKYLSDLKFQSTIKAYGLADRLKPGLSLEQSILIALFMDSINHNTYRTTTEISKIINDKLVQFRIRKGKQIITSKNNVSRYFNQRIYPYYEVHYSSGVSKFRISTTGASHTLRILKNLVSQ